MSDTQRLRPCSFPVRTIYEFVFVLLFSVPLLLFVFKWPTVEHVIQDKILAVRGATPSEGITREYDDLENTPSASV